MRFFSTWWKNVREVFGDRSDPHRVRLLADWYWKGMLLVAFVVVASVFVYGLFNLLRILSGLSVALDTSAPPPPALDHAALDATVAAFDARKAAFEALKTNRSVTVKDPSI